MSEQSLTRQPESGAAKAAVPGWVFVLWFPLSIFYQEMVVRAACFGTLLGRGTVYTLLFSLALGTFCTAFCALFTGKGRRRAALVLTAALTVWPVVQTVYNSIFRTFMTVYSIGRAADVFQFWRDIVSGVRETWFPLLLLLLPLIAVCVLRKRIPEGKQPRRILLILAGCAVGLQVTATAAVLLSTGGTISPSYFYREAFMPDFSVELFGVQTTLRLDIQQLIFPRKDEAPETTPTPQPSDRPAPTPTAEPGPTPEPAYEPNVLPIDLEALAEGTDNGTLADMHRWFNTRTPSMQNEYTGYFKDKNLILITAEGFSRWAVDPELTPTLYKLANSGFVFENFYNPLWWVSTSDGEYVATQSLLPKPGVWSMYHSGRNDLPFALGNQFRAQGYTTNAYHDHTFDYYGRDVSHSNMGYTYKGLGSGLDVTPTWPESDVEMMELSVPEYVGEAPFHTYYMTVSGHMNYNFMGNAMAAKHKDEVAHLDMSEEARAYLATQMELDRALENLIEQLDAAGVLEDTVIALSADHYPYGLEQPVLDELNGGPVDMRFEVYRSTFILWSAGMEETITVEKPCSSLDILPTLSNLFALPYDSRMLMGRDILSDSPGLVVLADRSFISGLGRYDFKADTFTPNEGVEVPPTYVPDMVGDINDMFLYSKRVLEQNYYGQLGLTE